ncbi:lipoprotein signal peptidase [Persicobacter psychrovividus]|uniref:Lipoprotein signal peptidase n=1 Tax=Persicobacter psychrovividus TaxID=387638 RepID=A0ABN6LG08_9BACT|nr:lipoprotein signal peptidase [Persicobacter psychrovividus]
MKYGKYFLIALLVIIVDQAVKMAVHFNMPLGTAGQIKVFGDWFKLHYTLNPGMAFGMQLGSSYGKLILTTFRLFAMFGIGWYLIRLAKKGAKNGLLVCIGLILGGAIGNLVDSIFYGVLLDNAPYTASTPWFHGQVIDMFYFDLWEGFLPKSIPFWGGKYMAFWPIFNVADSAIFVGVALILIFQKKFLTTVDGERLG